MDLILWRHAEAEDSRPDMGRKLTARGVADAARVAKWLHLHLPPQFTVLASPAERTQQTASALGVPFRTVPSIAPGASVAKILGAAGWPNGTATVIVVGHQPGLGQAAAHVLCDARDDWDIAKGGLWWFSASPHNEAGPVLVRAVISPGLV